MEIAVIAVTEYLIKDDGTVYVSTPALRKRKDMRVFKGTLDQAIAASGMEEDLFPTPMALPTDKPVDREKIERIKSAMAQMDPDNPDDYTTAGIPRLRVIKDVLNEPVRSEECHIAFSELRADGGHS